MNDHAMVATSQHIPLLRKGLTPVFGFSDALSSPIQGSPLGAVRALVSHGTACCAAQPGLALLHAVLCAAFSSFEAALGFQLLSRVS